MCIRDRLQALPDAVRFKAWRIATRTEVVSASGRQDDALKWLMKAEADDATIESLKKPGSSWASLDMKLATALTKACTGDIGNKIALASENAVKDGYVLRGRQIYRMVIDYFRVSEEQGALFDLTDLMSVRMSGGDLTSFLFSWKTILNGMKHVPEEPTKLHLFYTQVKEFKGIEWELEIYARAKPGDKERTYDYLLEACESYLTRKRLEKNRKAVEKQVSRGHNAAPAPSGDGGSSSGKGGKGNRKKVCLLYTSPSPRDS